MIRKSLGIIIPFLNEYESLISLNNKLLTLDKLKQYFKLKYIFVDDGSNDGSIEIVKKLKKKYTNSLIIVHKKNYGSHVAIINGIKHSKTDIASVFFPDQEFSADDFFKTLIKSINMQNSILMIRKNISIETSFLSRFFWKFYSLKSNLNIHNMTSFILLKKDIKLFDLKAIRINDNFFNKIFNKNIIWEKIKITTYKRKKGKSKWTFLKKIHLFYKALNINIYFKFLLIIGLVSIFYLYTFSVQLILLIIFMIVIDIINSNIREIKYEIIS